MTDNNKPNREFGEKDPFPYVDIPSIEKDEKIEGEKTDETKTDDRTEEDRSYEEKPFEFKPNQEWNFGKRDDVKENIWANPQEENSKEKKELEIKYFTNPDKPFDAVPEAGDTQTNFLGDQFKSEYPSDVKISQGKGEFVFNESTTKNNEDMKDGFNVFEFDNMEPGAIFKEQNYDGIVKKSQTTTSEETNTESTSTETQQSSDEPPTETNSSVDQKGEGTSSAVQNFMLDDGFHYQVRLDTDGENVAPPKVDLSDTSEEIFVMQELSPMPNQDISEGYFHQKAEEHQKNRKKVGVRRTTEDSEVRQPPAPTKEETEETKHNFDPNLSDMFLLNPKGKKKEETTTTTKPENEESDDSHSNQFLSSPEKRKSQKKKTPRFLKDDDEEEETEEVEGEEGEDDKKYRRVGRKGKKEKYTLSKQVVSGYFENVEEMLKDNPLRYYSVVDIEETLFLLTRRKKLSLVHMMLKEKICKPTRLALNTAVYEPYFDQDICSVMFEYCESREIFENNEHLLRRLKTNRRALELYEKRFGILMD